MSDSKTYTSKYEIDMINGALMPKLITFFVPLMISGVFQLLFNAVDLVVVGNWVGSDALAAVGATTALINVFCNLMIGISLGANVMAARYIAVGDDKSTSDIVHTSISIAIIIGVGISLLGLAFSGTCLELMDTPANVLGDSTLYLKIYFCGTPFFALYNYGSAILRATGDTRRPLYYLIFAGILNVVLNLILVVVFKRGVDGVAIATVVSQLVSCVLVLRCLSKTEESYKLNIRKLRINKGFLINILKIGLPAGIQSTIINFSNVLLQSSVNSFGSIAMAGYTAANNLLGFLYMSVNSITQACMSFTSQNYAVRKYDRIKRIIAECLFLEFTVAMTIGGLVYIFGEQILGIYTDSASVIESGMNVLAYTTLTYFLCGIMDCIPGVMRGLGHSAVPMVLSIIGTVGTRLVWIYGLFPKHKTVDFLFVSYPASWIFTIVMQTICLFFVYRKAYKDMEECSIQQI